MKQKIKDRNGKERILNERSLENLKLEPIFRDQGKQRFNTTLRPETIAWLKRGGNVCQRIEDLVDAARSGVPFATRVLPLYCLQSPQTKSFFAAIW